MHVCERLITVLLALVVSMSGAVAQRLNTFESKLKPHESDIASLCFLFQGLPSKVQGTSFHYDIGTDLEHEKYLSNLLRSPNESQTVLRDCAVFLSSRTYLGQDLQPYLLLARRDSVQRLGQLGVASDPRWTWQDALLCESLQAYYRLGLTRRVENVTWSSAEKRVYSVQKNVERLVGKIKVTNRIEESWFRPHAVR